MTTPKGDNGKGQTLGNKGKGKEVIKGKALKGLKGLKGKGKVDVKGKEAGKGKPSGKGKGEAPPPTPQGEVADTQVETPTTPATTPAEVGSTPTSAKSGGKGQEPQGSPSSLMPPGGKRVEQHILCVARFVFCIYTQFYIYLFIQWLNFKLFSWLGSRARASSVCFRTYQRRARARTQPRKKFKLFPIRTLADLVYR